MIKTIISIVLLSNIAFSKIITNDFPPTKQDFYLASGKLDYNLDILDGQINNSFVKPKEARVETIVYILDSGCVPLVKSFVNQSIGYHGVAVERTLRITLPDIKTSVKCIQTLPTVGSGHVSNYLKALSYIYSLPRHGRSRVIINISASVQSNKYKKMNKLIKKMAYNNYEFVIAAGNLGSNSPLGADACLYSLTNLAWLKNVYVVGATTQSRTGKCVEYYYPSSYRSVHPFSGSSFAAPVFAGLLASF